MELRDIKKLNQSIYELDTDISRNSKVIFIAALIFCLAKNRDFQNSDKLTSFINFVREDKKPIDQLLELAENEVKKLNLQASTHKAVMNSLKTISGVNTNLDRNRAAFQEFIHSFIRNDYPSIKNNDLFFETLYMEVDKKASKSNEGIVLTPTFAAQLMIDLADLDYKKDIVADLCSGTGLFSLLSYSTMISKMDNDHKNNEITKEEKDKYNKRLYNAIIANDNDPKMTTLSLANFMLKNLNESLLFSEDVLKLEKSSLKFQTDGVTSKIYPTKAILNPPYEDKYKPLDIVYKNIELVKGSNCEKCKVVVIIPPQKFGQSKEIFSKILNIATLESVIKTQDDLFTESGKSQPASIFIFNVDKQHKKEDIIRYYNFTDTGYVYLKDSGLVDKNQTYETKKAELLNKITTSSTKMTASDFVRTWSNFYEVNKELEFDAKIDPNRIKINKQEADITFENITIKKMLQEKNELISSVNNSFVDVDGSFEKYIIDILSKE
ncbi:hypothetical protein NV226_02385 [Mycoplasma iguanae]|uniref:Uncharacterized protein n=1 Tax=Mycoplasma iguanae TaxID=292461 RepID=A0ABY5RAB6_9MOLU|nr:hypothetical protein [Mycoplasma iguanae]UVD81555.1 hypothetical protein NV226_02385 [Mycoplasma iguanae]